MQMLIDKWGEEWPTSLHLHRALNPLKSSRIELSASSKFIEPEYGQSKNEIDNGKIEEGAISLEQAHQKMLYKPHQHNTTCSKFIIAIIVIHGAEPSKHMFLQCLQKDFHFCDEGTSHFCFRQHCREAMSPFFLSSFISFCPNWALLCPRHLYYIADTKYFFLLSP